MNIFKFSKIEFFSLILIITMVFSRIIPHPPNFTPIIAVSILSGYFFKDLKLSLIILLITMLVSDLFIGFYKTMIFVYFSLFIITFFSFKLQTKIKIKNLYLFGIVSSLIFFVISNLGVWLLGNMYSKIGILKKNLFKKVTRSDLVAG